MPFFERHLFVCANCRSADSFEPPMVSEAFFTALAAQGVIDRVGVTRCGCLDVCRPGTTVVVYPEGTWYCGVTEDDVTEIVESHIVGGVPVERLLLPPADDEDDLDFGP